MSENNKVWFIFGSKDPAGYEFDSLAELNAFIEGVQAAGDAFDGDYTQLNSKEEVIAYLRELDEDEDDEPICDCGKPGESSYCGTICRKCWRQHIKECQVCRDDDGHPYNQE